MSREITFWITPWTELPSLQAAIDQVNAQIDSVSKPARRWHGNLLLPTHYGPWPQAECSNTLPADLTVATPDDITRIRGVVEAAGLGFGAWGVPLGVVDHRAPGVNIPELAASHAAAAGYYSANFEPGKDFWAPGNDPTAIDAWWSGFWNGLPDQNAMAGNVSVTLIPSPWGIEAFGGTLGNLMGGGRDSAINLVGGATAVIMETYGGPNTQNEYPFPSLWPAQSFDMIHGSTPFGRVDLLAPGTRFLPMLALANLQSQLTMAGRLSNGDVHVWAI